MVRVVGKEGAVVAVIGGAGRGGRESSGMDGSRQIMR